jgi:hypothetical protein
MGPDTRAAPGAAARAGAGSVTRRTGVVAAVAYGLLGSGLLVLAAAVNRPPTALVLGLGGLTLVGTALARRGRAPG